MPKVVPNFEPSLVSWQPPKRFIGQLGHSISASGPSGLVEGMAVLPPAPPVEPVADGDRGASYDPLPLAIPPAAPRESAPARTWRLPWRRSDPAPTETALVTEEAVAQGETELPNALSTPASPPDEPAQPALSESAAEPVATVSPDQPQEPPTGHH